MKLCFVVIVFGLSFIICNKHYIKYSACYKLPIPKTPFYPDAYKFANTKEEVVYSKLKNDGTNYSTVVSERITNTDNSELINDISELLNIENTNGDETFEQNGTNVVWKANGKDIQYQGTIDKDEPITCKVKYELNGKEVEAKDIVGKSGNVKVTLTYTNNDAHTVKVNGKYEKIA